MYLKFVEQKNAPTLSWQKEEKKKRAAQRLGKRKVNVCSSQKAEPRFGDIILSQGRTGS